MNIEIGKIYLLRFSDGPDSTLRYAKVLNRSAMPGTHDVKMYQSSGNHLELNVYDHELLQEIEPSVDLV